MRMRKDYQEHLKSFRNKYEDEGSLKIEELCGVMRVFGVDFTYEILGGKVGKRELEKSQQVPFCREFFGGKEEVYYSLDNLR